MDYLSSGMRSRGTARWTDGVSVLSSASDVDDLRDAPWSQAVALAILPYLAVRGPVNRLARTFEKK
jgi:hypothetical protein